MSDPIRRPIPARRRIRGRRLRGYAGLAAAAGLTVSLGLLAGCGSGDDSTAADPDAPASTTPAAAESSTAAGAAAGRTTTVPVYFVGSSPAGPALFREDADVPADDPLTGAVQALEQGSPKDPDYRTSYSSGTFGSVSYDATDGFTVELTDPALAERGGRSKKAATVAAQQLVYTLEAAQGVKGKPVRVTADGRPTTFLGFDTSKGLMPADQLGVLGLVNILSPEEGGTLAGKASIGGLANSPEATVPWTLKNANGKVVKKGFATASGWMDRLYPWKATVDVNGLPPGSYTLTAATDDPSGGTEGGGPTTDTKTVTIG